MSELFFFIVPIAMITTTPVGDSCIVNLFRKFLWFTILRNTPWKAYVFITILLIIFILYVAFIAYFQYVITLMIVNPSKYCCGHIWRDPFWPLFELIEQSGKRSINRPSFKSPRPKSSAKDAKQGRVVSTKPACLQKELKQKEKVKTREVSIKSQRDKRLDPILEHQSGVISSEWDKYITELTLLDTLRRLIMSVSDKSGLAAALVMYAQAHTRTSLLNHVLSYGRNVALTADTLMFFINTSTSLSEQSGEPISDIAWIDDIKSCLNNWKRYRHSKVSKSFLNLVNYVVSVGLCSKANLTFTIGNVCLFAPMVTKRQLNACDLYEVLAETVLGFLEGGWRVYTTKRISAFFLEEDLFLAFEKSYNDIRAIHGFAIAGNLRRYANTEENEYELQLDAAISAGEKLLKSLGSEISHERKFVSDRLDRIRDYRTEFVQIRTRGGMRLAPFGISLFGDSAVGKSTLNQLTYEAIGAYNDIVVTPDRVATWADNDKFASNVRASTNVIVFDDFGNTTPDFMDFSPCYRLLQCVNNALFNAPMAEVSLKGKVGLHPFIVMITTNVEHLLANVYSQKPESILRRFFHVKVEVKDEFLKDGKLDEQAVREKFGYTKVPDMWKLSVRKCVVGAHIAIGSNNRSYQLEPIIYKGKKMENVSVFHYLEWAQVASKTHYEQQRGLVECMRTEGLDKCNLCGFCACKCDKVVADMIPLHVDDEPSMEPHAGRRRRRVKVSLKMYGLLLSIMASIFMSVFAFFYYLVLHWAISIPNLPQNSRFARILRVVDIFIIRMRGRLIMRIQGARQSLVNFQTDNLVALQNFYNHYWLFDYVVYLPDRVCYSWLYLGYALYQRRVEIYQRRQHIVMALCVIYVGTIGLFCCQEWLRAFLWFTLANCAIAICIQCEKMLLAAELMDRRDVVPSSIRWLRNHYITALAGVVGALYVLLKVYVKTARMTEQGNLIPTSITDIEERDQEVNPWAELQISPTPMTVKSKTTTCDNLVQLCLKNAVIVESDKYVTRGFFLTSNVLLVPKHYIATHRDNGYKGDIRVRCFRTARDKVGANFREVLADSYSYEIPETDFVAYYSPSSGSCNDLTGFLPTGFAQTSDARFIQKNVDCDDIISPILFEAQDVSHRSLKNFKGGKYKLPYNSFNGLCMAPIVSKGHGSCILGFHLCGNGIIGGAGTLLHSQAVDAIAKLNDMDGCIVTAAAADFPEELYGFPTMQSGSIHRKSATRFISPGNTLEVYGPTTGMATPHSNVVETIISPFVEQVTGVPQQWGPPRMFGKNVYPFQAALETLAHPSLSLGSFIRPSVVCYRSVFPEIRRRIPQLFSRTRPLTEVETVSGIDGVRFIDALNMKSSPGWPFTGRKDKLIIDLDPEDYPHISRPRTFIPKIWQEVYRCSDLLLRNERPYFIWKACLKDEPTKLTKTKVRVFQSAPIALQVLIRMYFLPVVRIIQCNPLESECLVGANAEGPEWEQMNAFMVSKGPNILAGDYSKYDQRMPAQLVIAAFDVLIWIAQHLCDYSSRDIHIMTGIVGEVSFPLMAYNGDLIQLFGSNPSGQNLTVVINSIANSILLRSCYYHLYPQDIRECLFRNYCAMATYGDDVKGSVAEERSSFNHISYANFLADFDIVFTMPDKESIATRYMDAEEADFLKRINRYHEDLKINVGILSESSIFKRLHSHLRSKELSLPLQSAANIDSSLHDWFYYGRETFEYRRKQLLEIAQRADIIHLCRGFDVSYDERIRKWEAKYRPRESDVDLSQILFESIITDEGDSDPGLYICDFDKELGRS